MATHSTILAWRIPWTEEPGGLESMGSQSFRQDLGTKPPAGSPCEVSKRLPVSARAGSIFQEVGARSQCWVRTWGVGPWLTPLNADWLPNVTWPPHKLWGPSGASRDAEKGEDVCPQFLITVLRLGVQGKGQVSYQRKSKGEESFPSGPNPKLPKLIYSCFPDVQTLFPWHVHTAWQYCPSGAVDTPGHHFSLQGIMLMPRAKQNLLTGLPMLLASRERTQQRGWQFSGLCSCEGEGWPSSSILCLMHFLRGNQCPQFRSDFRIQASHLRLQFLGSHLGSSWSCHTPRTRLLWINSCPWWQQRGFIYNGADKTP